MILQGFHRVIAKTPPEYGRDRRKEDPPIDGNVGRPNPGWMALNEIHLWLREQEVTWERKTTKFNH